jgi:PAS domain-containing protein
MSGGIEATALLTALALVVAGSVAIVAVLLNRLREAREGRRTAEAKLEIVECVAEVGTWDFAADTRIIDLSPQAFAIFNRPPAKGMMSVEEAVAYYHPEDRELVRAAFNRSLIEGEDFEYHARIVDETGRLRYVLARGAARFADGRISGVFGSVIEMRGPWRRVPDGSALADQG